MKLYMHPVSMTSRPVRLFIAENNIPVEEQMINIFTGEHLQEPFASINPSKCVPVLEDGDFRLTESSAILKYLADKMDSPAYPKDLQRRGKVNEMMDWFNTGFYREFGYGLVYPQILPHYRRPSDEVQSGTIDWGKDKAKKSLQVLNDHWIGPDNPFLCGEEITIADFLAVGFLTQSRDVLASFRQSRHPQLPFDQNLIQGWLHR